MNLCETLAFSVESSQESLSNLISDITNEQATTKPESEKWSINECLEHLYLVEKSISKLLTMKTEGEEENCAEAPEKFGNEKMRQILSNRNQKYSAPDRFAPNGTFSSLTEAKPALAALRTELADALRQGQVRFNSVTVPHPRMGEFTRLDWVNFLLEHASRHYQQIEELKMQQYL